MLSKRDKKGPMNFIRWALVPFTIPVLIVVMAWDWATDKNAPKRWTKP